MKLTRRGLLGTGGLLILGGLAGCGGYGGSASTVDRQQFTRPLAIPELAPSTIQDGVRVFSITAQQGRTDFGHGPTPTLGYNRAQLGPTLRANRGEQIAVHVHNRLDESTSVHWHGMHLPAAMDGGPHQEIEPDGDWRPSWRIDQPAATLWYHPHPHGHTEEQTFRGLAGMFIIDDDASVAARLPHRYGIDDIPVIVQDKAFDNDGHLQLKNDGGEPGTLGNVVITNGTVGAYQRVRTGRVRLRLLNGSTARTYEFGFADRRMQLVATDGGLRSEPLSITRIRLVPGERAEVVITMEPGETTRLHSYPAGLGKVASDFAMGGHDSFDVLELRADDRLADSPEPSWRPSKRAAADALDEHAVARTRRFELDERKINDKLMDLSRIDEVIMKGSTEIWEVHNLVPMPHSFHVHDIRFEVLSVDGQPPPAVLAGWKDTIYVEPKRTYRLLMRFDDYTDSRMPYMYHCHMLMHEDEGMMGQFLVVEPGDQDVPRTIPGDREMPTDHQGHS